MDYFTTESAVRERFHLPDEESIPDSLIALSIGDAHRTILRFLEPGVDTEDPPHDVARGEALLAGAHLFRALAAREAFDQQRRVMGRQRIEESARFRSLREMAATAEAEAWVVLAPFLGVGLRRAPAGATDTKPVLGEEGR